MVEQVSLWWNILGLFDQEGYRWSWVRLILIIYYLSIHLFVCLFIHPFMYSFWFFKTGFVRVALADLELTLQT